MQRIIVAFLASIVLACGPTLDVGVDVDEPVTTSGPSSSPLPEPDASSGTPEPPGPDDDSTGTEVDDACPDVVVETIDVVQRPHRIVATDLDGDGAPDLFVGAADGTFRIYSNDGAGQLAVTGMGSTTGIQWASSADFDEDGAMDVAVLGGDGWLSFLWGDANGALTPDGSILSEGALGLESLDVDDDGAADLILGLPHGVGVLRSLGDRSFGPLETHGTQATRVAGRGDIDGDGDVDVFTSIDGPGIGVAINQGEGAFVLETWTSAHGVNNLVMGALGGGAELDIIFSQSNLVYRAAGLGGGQYAQPQQIYADLSGWVGVDLLDMDGSGTPEIVVTGFESIAIVSVTAGQIETRTFLVDGGVTRAKADLDNDGREELLLGTDDALVKIIRCET